MSRTIHEEMADESERYGDDYHRKDIRRMIYQNDGSAGYGDKLKGRYYDDEGGHRGNKKIGSNNKQVSSNDNQGGIAWPSINQFEEGHHHPRGAQNDGGYGHNIDRPNNAYDQAARSPTRNFPQTQPTGVQSFSPSKGSQLDNLLAILQVLNSIPANPQQQAATQPDSCPSCGFNQNCAHCRHTAIGNQNPIRYEIKNVNIRQCDHGFEEQKSELSNSIVMTNDRRAAAHANQSPDPLNRMPPHIQDIISNLHSRVGESMLDSQVVPKRSRPTIQKLASGQNVRASANYF